MAKDKRLTRLDTVFIIKLKQFRKYNVGAKIDILLAEINTTFRNRLFIKIDTCIIASFMTIFFQ